MTRAAAKFTTEEDLEELVEERGDLLLRQQLRLGSLLPAIRELEVRYNGVPPPSPGS